MVQTVLGFSTCWCLKFYKRYFVGFYDFNFIQGSSSNSFNSSQTGSDDIFERTHHHSGPFLNAKRPEAHQGSNTLVARIRRMSGRNCRPKSVADMDELTKNLQNIKMTNSQAQEYNSIEHLEAAQYAGVVTSVASAPRAAPSYAQVRSSRSLYFSAEAKSRTWNQQDTRTWRAQEGHPGHQAHRLSVSSFRWTQDTIFGLMTS